MDSKIPSNYGKVEVERMMLKLFPEYKIKWLNLSR